VLEAEKEFADDGNVHEVEPIVQLGHQLRGIAVVMLGPGVVVRGEELATCKQQEY
jgi:hypothetical protein